MKQFIGLNLYLYTFKTSQAAQRKADKLRNKGTVTKIFINGVDEYGFEFKENRIVY